MKGVILARWSTGKIVGIAFLCIFVLFIFSGGCFFIGLLTGSLGGTSYALGDSVYEIRLEGVISAEKYSGLFGVVTVTPEKIISQLDEARKNPNVKAILIRVNSPGGSAAASQEIYEELKKVEKPVVVSVSEVCASGAYYVASAADRIIANRSSSVGSIGVIMQIPNFEDLYEKLGIKYTTIKQGKFIADVAEGRNMDISEVEELATGWVFLGTEALELGLIDGIGNYKDAINIAAELGGIKGEPNVIRQELGFSLIDLILGYYLNLVISKIF